MPTIYIHIGTEKTGTTSLQRFFKENRNKLLEEGILYPSLLGRDNNLAHWRLAASVLKSLEPNKVIDFAPNIEYDIDKEFLFLSEQAKSNPHKNILISAEHFSSRFKREHIHLLHEQITKSFPDYKITILLNIRRQDSLFLSSYSTSIKSGSLQSVEDFYRKAMEKSDYFNYLKMVDLWSGIFGRDSLELSTFDESLQKGLITTFLHNLNVSMNIDELRYRDNESLSCVATSCGAVINGMSKLNSRRAIQNLSSRTMDYKGYIIPQEYLSSLAIRFKEDNKYIANEYFDREVLFANDDYVWVENYNYISSNQALEKAMEVLMMELIQ